MPVLNLKIPEKYHFIFNDEDLVEIRSEDRRALESLLWWAWSKKAAWISNNPLPMKQAFRQSVEDKPGVDSNRIKFLSPNELLLQSFEYAVIEEPEIIPNAVSWSRQNVTKQLRIYEPSHSDKTTEINDLGLSLEERKQLLVDVRAKRNREYDEYSLISSITSESLYEFVLEFWPIVVPETYKDNWHIRYLCEELQIVAERAMAGKPKLYDLIINIAPGSTKSLLTSVMLPAWCWTRMPSMRYIGGSYAQTLAMDLSRKNRQIVKSAKFQLCFGIKMRTDQDSKTFFMNEHGGMRLGMGTGGIAGFHAHIIGIDDPLDPQKSVSEVEMRAANKWITESLNQRKVDQTITPIILIMQRLHQGDPTGEMLERSGGYNIKHICIPAELTDDVKPVELREFYKPSKGSDTPVMDTVRLPWSTLQEKKKLGQFMYSGQYLQTPTLPEGGMFKFEKIKVLKPKKVEFKKIIRFWDKADTADDGCFSVGLKMGQQKDNEDIFWVLNVVRGQWDSGRREAIIDQTAQADGLDVEIGVEQEPGSGGKESALKTKERLQKMGFKCRIDRPSGNKIMRADPFSTAVNDGRVRAVPGEWLSDYLEEISLFPLGKFMDQVDASSGAFTILTRPLVRVGGGFK